MLYIRYKYALGSLECTYRQQQGLLTSLSGKESDYDIVPIESCWGSLERGSPLCTYGALPLPEGGQSLQRVAWISWYYGVSLQSP